MLVPAHLIAALILCCLLAGCSGPSLSCFNPRCHCFECPCGGKCECGRDDVTVTTPGASIESVARPRGGKLPSVMVFQVAPKGDPLGERQRPAFVAVGTECMEVAEFSFIDPVGAAHLFPELRLTEFPATVVYSDDLLVEVRTGVQSEDQLRAIVAKWRSDQ